jgi:hypothetical protein
LLRSLGLLIAGSFTVWLLVAYPAFRWWGEWAVVYSAVAAALCLVPTAATLVWSRQAFQGAPEQQLLAVMGGTGVRLVVVIGGGIALYYLDPYFGHPAFWIWIIVFYLVTLTLEVGLILSHQAAPRSPSN